MLTCARLWGVTWWCSHDVDRALLDFPELEYGLGLLRTDGSVKPVGAAVSRAVAAARSTPPSVAPRPTALALDADPNGRGRAASAPGGAYFEAWMRLAAEGHRPAVVLASRVSDQAYLAERGITTVL